MIELLVKYIQDHGYDVEVRPGYLSIRKIVKEQLFAIPWSISKVCLRPDMEERLYESARYIMSKIDQAIQQAGGPQP